MSFENCKHRQEELIHLFSNLPKTEDKYEKLIELGRELPPFPKDLMTDACLVKGCQSTLYLHSELKSAKLYCQVFSNAFISAGLAAVLISIYNYEPPEAVIQCPPYLLKKIGIFDLLSPNRVNGLKSFYIRMQQDAIQLIKATHL